MSWTLSGGDLLKGKKWREGMTSPDNITILEEATLARPQPSAADLRELGDEFTGEPAS